MKNFQINFAYRFILKKLYKVESNTSRLSIYQIFDFIFFAVVFNRKKTIFKI